MFFVRTDLDDISLCEHQPLLLKLSISWVGVPCAVLHGHNSICCGHISDMGLAPSYLPSHLRHNTIAPPEIFQPEGFSQKFEI